jgi:hypothetical protein
VGVETGVGDGLRVGQVVGPDEGEAAGEADDEPLASALAAVDAEDSAVALEPLDPVQPATRTTIRPTVMNSLRRRMLYPLLWFVPTVIDAPRAGLVSAR